MAGLVWRQQRSGEIRGAREGIPAITVVSLFVDKVGADGPVSIERVLNAAGDVNCVRRLIVPINQVPHPAVGVPGNATSVLCPVGILHGIHARSRRRVYALKSSRPSALGEVVVKDAKAGADHSGAAVSGRIGNTNTRVELVAVVVGRADRNLQGLQRDVGGILRLAAARSREKAVGGLPAQSIVDREPGRHAPGIFRVEREALHTLREAAIAGGSGRSARVKVRDELSWIVHIERGIVGETVERLLISRKRAAEHGLVNEIDAELESVIAGGVADVVAELILLLIAQGWKESNRCGELIVAEGLEAGDG